jgi:competence protein ComEC
MRLVYLALGWTAGLLLVESGILILTQTTFAVLAFLLLMVLIVAWPYPTDRWINLTLLALVLGAGRYTFVPTTSEVALLNNGGGVTIEGIVSAEPDVRDDRTLLRVDVERAHRADLVYDVEGMVLVRLPQFVDVRYGDRVEVTGALSTPGEFDTFSYADFLARQGVFSIMDNASLRGITGEVGFSFRRSLSDLRGRLLRAIGQMLPEPQAGCSPASCWGMNAAFHRSLPTISAKRAHRTSSPSAALTWRLSPG